MKLYVEANNSRNTPVYEIRAWEQVTTGHTPLIKGHQRVAWKASSELSNFGCSG
jgi:hypothetical protein